MVVSRLIGNKKDLIRKYIVVKMWVEYLKYMLEMEVYVEFVLMYLEIKIF